MKKIFLNISRCFLLVFLLGSCQPGSSEEVSSNEVTSVPEKVTITFEQYDCDFGPSGTVFIDSDVRATTQIVYEYGHYLTDDEIDLFDEQINYDVPELNGDGYYSFTYYYFSKENPNSNKIVQMTLVEDFTLYFGIYG